MSPTQQGLAEWHTLATAPDPERLARLVAQDAVFHSPVVHTPQEGRALVVSYLSAAAATLAKGQSAVWNTSSDRHQYLVAPKGRVTVNGREAQPRDGIAVTGESEIVVEALDDAEIVLVDAR